MLPCMVSMTFNPVPVITGGAGDSMGAVVDFVKEIHGAVV